MIKLSELNKDTKVLYIDTTFEGVSHLTTADELRYMFEIFDLERVDTKVFIADIYELSDGDLASVHQVEALLERVSESEVFPDSFAELVYEELIYDKGFILQLTKMINEKIAKQIDIVNYYTCGDEVFVD